MPVFSQITLEGILLEISIFESLYVWSVQIIEGVGDIENVVGMPMVEFEKHCDGSKQGYITDLTTLLNLNKACEDIIEIVVVGCKLESDIPKAFKDKKWEEKCDVIISLDDSSLWQLASKNNEIDMRFNSLVDKGH